MAYLGLARKWRPQTFDDVVGQDIFVQILQNAIRYNRVGQAYILTGTRGIGKTTLFRLFAKALRCDNPPKPGTSCNHCIECEEISESRSVDVIEIDGASWNGVDAIRSLTETILFAPRKGKQKIIIIDEVHSLSSSAFNALLKTLEEPPSHALFMFATTELHKLPLTITSRCQTLELHQISQEDIQKRLLFICQQEEVTVDKEGLAIISHYSQGSLRDALSLLDQALSFISSTNQAGEKISLTVGNIQTALGVPARTFSFDILSLIINKNLPTLIQELHKAFRSGHNLSYITKEILESTRDLYLFCLFKEDAPGVIEDFALKNIISSPQKVLDAFEPLSKKIDLITLERMMQMLEKALEKIDYAAYPEALLETTLIRMALIHKLSFELPKDKGLHNMLEPTTSPQPMIASSSSVPAPTPIPQNKEDNNQDEDFAKQFISQIRSKKPLLASLLEHCELRWSSEKNELIVATIHDSFYAHQLMDIKSKTELSLMAQSFLHPQITVLVIQEKTQALRTSHLAHQQHYEKIKNSILNDPRLSETEKLIDGKVVHISVKENEVDYSSINKDKGTKDIQV